MLRKSNIFLICICIMFLGTQHQLYALSFISAAAAKKLVDIVTIGFQHCLFKITIVNSQLSKVTLNSTLYNSKVGRRRGDRIDAEAPRLFPNFCFLFYSYMMSYTRRSDQRLPWWLWRTGIEAGVPSHRCRLSSSKLRKSLNIEIMRFGEILLQAITIHSFKNSLFDQ